MKKFIGSIVVAFAVLAIVGFANAEVNPVMNWESGTLVINNLPTDVPDLEPYAHIAKLTPDKKRETYTQSFALNVTDFSYDGKDLNVTVLIPEKTGKKIVHIWANNGKGKYLYCNPNEYWAYPALNKTTGVLHYNHTFVVDFDNKAVIRVARGTQMDEFEAPATN